jgi:hypothetical protein
LCSDSASYCERKQPDKIVSFFSLSVHLQRVPDILKDAAATIGDHPAMPKGDVRSEEAFGCLMRRG